MTEFDYKDKELTALSPLADPVVAAIFSDIENAGLASASLINAVLSSDGMRIGNVISVTPQRYYKHPGERGCRIDVAVVTDQNEQVVVEVQMYPEPAIYQRNLFSASRIFVNKSAPGSTSDVMAAKMPRVIAINIMDFNVRGDENKDFFQPVKPLYTKPPHTAAFPQLAVYGIQLPRFRETEKDFTDPLHCWLYAMDTAASEKLSIKEVIEMNAKLQQFVTMDEGFRQYCDQYNRVAADPETREEYYRWVSEQMRQQGILQAAREDGERSGELRGELLGELRRSREVAVTLLEMGLTPKQVSKGSKLPLEDVMAMARDKAKKPPAQ
jgi:predicted transposase/invertase (TIGR01784 family)